VNRPSWLVANFLIFFFLVLLSSAAESSFLHWIFSWRPTIQVALVFLVYISLYRAPAEGLLFVVLSCYCMGLESVMLQSACVFSGVCVFLLLQILRARVYSSSSVYFTWTSLGAILAFHIISWLTSVFLDTRAPSPKPLDWLLEVMLTALFVRLIYSLCLWIDQKTKRISITELNT
jgi:hypothetical protein